ncbi:MotA/TolQ/ExbB proton channel family protein [Yoonia maritima]|uniref:MotA/TolQ/ExbB proton channel family protein n=1 Tax=Yoonia maritima TaxID=1435347 RepID=UPI000D1039C8|nr:MotA/TolQ/ExbB proton channel family protein [Yoonia maritima]
MDFQTLIAPLLGIIETGGPVVAILIACSVLAVTVTLYKLWQFYRAGVGRHVVLRQSVNLWDQNQHAPAIEALNRSNSYLAPVIRTAYYVRDTAPSDLSARLEAEAEARFLKLERGFRFLDNVAQLAPLLGLFGTVLGMISAFQSLQDAGNQVDPSILAGGIWVALMTTAVGLAVAMPTSLVLSWFEQRMDAERVFAGQVIQAVVAPSESWSEKQPSANAA